MTFAGFKAFNINGQTESPPDKHTDRMHAILLCNLPGFYTDVYYYRADRIKQVTAFTGI